MRPPRDRGGGAVGAILAKRNPADFQMMISNRPARVPDANAVVDQIIAALREQRRERLYAAYDEAANDPAFVAEMDAIAREFDPGLPSGE